MQVNRLLLLAALCAVGCGASGPPRKPPGKPPTPQTVTVAEPGGDAHDPHAAALQRLLDEPWGRRNDKDNQLHAPLIDWKTWKRVRYWGVEHFLGFRYGDDHHVVALAFLRDIEEGTNNASERCNRRWEKWARPKLKAFEVQLSTIGQRVTEWRGEPLMVRYVDGYVDYALKRRHFSAAWASYPAYPDACLTYSMAVTWDGSEDLARQVRDRFVQEGFEQLLPLTETRPYRKK